MSWLQQYDHPTDHDLLALDEETGRTRWSSDHLRPGDWVKHAWYLPCGLGLVVARNNAGSTVVLWSKEPGGRNVGVHDVSFSSKGIMLGLAKQPMIGFIKIEDTKLDKWIEHVSDVIVEQTRDDSETSYAGLLNYAITQLAMQVIDKRFGEVRYGIIATVSGVLKNVGDEFYRRVAAPYEDKQITKNGDVPLYKSYSGPRT